MQDGSSGPPAAIAQSVRVSRRSPREPLRRACGSGEWPWGPVAMGAEDVAEAVGRVGDLDLDPGQAALEEFAEEDRAGREAGPVAGGQLRLQPVLLVAVDEVVVVVAGGEDEAAADHLRGDQRQQAVGGLDRVVDRAEEEVEENAEEDQLVDAGELGRQPLEEELLAQQVTPGPGAEVGVGDDQRAHQVGSSRMWPPNPLPNKSSRASSWTGLSGHFAKHASEASPTAPFSTHLRGVYRKRYEDPPSRRSSGASDFGLAPNVTASLLSSVVSTDVTLRPARRLKRLIDYCAACSGRSRVNRPETWLWTAPGPSDYSDAWARGGSSATMNWMGQPGHFLRNEPHRNPTNTFSTSWPTTPS